MLLPFNLEGQPLSTSCDSIGMMDSSLRLQCLDSLDVSIHFCSTITQTTQGFRDLKAPSCAEKSDILENNEGCERHCFKNEAL